MNGIRNGNVDVDVCFDGCGCACGSECGYVDVGVEVKVDVTWDGGGKRNMDVDVNACIGMDEGAEISVDLRMYMWRSGWI